MHTQETHWIAADGTQLLARSWRPDGPIRGAVALVHGLGEHSGRYGEVARHLTDGGFGVVAIDLRGHGRSPGHRGHAPDVETLLDDLSLLLDHAADFAEAAPVFLYGHSLGGSLVLTHGLRRKPNVAGAIVTSPLLQPTTPPPLWKTTLGRALNRMWPTLTFRTALDVTMLSRDDAAVQAYRDDPLVHQQVSARLGTQMFAAGLWALAHADRWTLPLLLMHGAADALTSADASREFARRAGDVCTLEVWDQCRHELHWELSRREVMRHTVDWLDRVVRGGK